MTLVKGAYLMAIKYYNEIKKQEIRKFYGKIEKNSERKKTTSFFERKYALETASKKDSLKSKPIVISYSNFDVNIFTKTNHEEEKIKAKQLTKIR